MSTIIIQSLFGEDGFARRRDNVVSSSLNLELTLNLPDFIEINQYQEYIMYIVELYIDALLFYDYFIVIIILENIERIWIIL